MIYNFNYYKFLKEMNLKDNIQNKAYYEIHINNKLIIEELTERAYLGLALHDLEEDKVNIIDNEYGWINDKLYFIDYGIIDVDCIEEINNGCLINNRYELCVL